MTTTKEGRGRKTPGEMPSKIGRLMFHDLKNSDKTGFSPFLEKSFLSKHFYTSREEYQKMKFGSFQSHARKTAAQVIATMKPAERQEEIDKLARITSNDQTNTPIEASIHDTSSSPLNASRNRVQSLRDTIVAPYPNGEMAIIIFEVDGDIDGAFELQFANNGQQIAVRSRVPVELTKAELLLGTTKERKQVQDADSMLLNQVIKERLLGCETSHDGNLWELREIIDLPFPCKQTLYNRFGDEIPNYLLRKNNKGYAWGYFWVVGQHVGLKEECPTTIRCKTASDDESDEESAGATKSSQLDSSDDEMLQDMMVHCESMSEDDASEEELDQSAETPKFETVHECNQRSEELKQDVQLLEQSIESKNCEIIQLKQIINGYTQQSEELQRVDETLKMKNDEISKLHSEISQLKQIISEYTQQSEKLKSVDENFKSLQDTLQLKNDEISKLQKIIHENNKCHDQRERDHTDERDILKASLDKLEINVEQKEKDCALLNNEINELKQAMEVIKCEINGLNLALESKIAEVVELETKWRTEKEQRAAEKKVHKAEEKKNKELQIELKSAVEYKKASEKALLDKQREIKQLQMTVDQKQHEIETREQRLEELQLVINWKEEHYRKIHQSLQERICSLENDRHMHKKPQENLYYQEDGLDPGSTNEMTNGTESEPRTFPGAKTETERPTFPVVDDTKFVEISQDSTIKPKLSAEAKTTETEHETSPVVDDDDTKVVENSQDSTIIPKLAAEEKSCLNNEERTTVLNDDTTQESNKENANGQSDERANDPPTQPKLIKSNQKSSRRKEKQVAKKRQNQKQKLQVWMSQVEAEERRKKQEKIKPLRNEPNENIPQKEDGWGFSDDELEIQESAQLNRKRNSSAIEPLPESERGPPTKKIRKSRRLEEKRLAKSKID